MQAIKLYPYLRHLRRFKYNVWVFDNEIADDTWAFMKEADEKKKLKEELAKQYPGY